LDIRYIDHNPWPGKIYCLSVMGGYSRAILASLLSRSQDPVAVLLVRYAAIRAHRILEALLTDSGGVFRANHIRRIYETPGIRKEEIARRQPWQNLIEANFGVQMRMTDYGFANAASWEELSRVHEQWRGDVNAQIHWARTSAGKTAGVTLRTCWTVP